jgi:calcium/calmodulin-dependent protein kinase I
MGYHAKGDLQTYLDNYPCLLEEECREIIRQVVEGLYIMHREGFAHRDVKPSVREI